MRLLLENVTKRYGGLTALHPLSMTAEGEILGIIGNNGAGKSTLMKMTVGLLAPGKGKIRLGEIDVRKAPEKAKRWIGYLPESPLLYPRLTAEELLTYVGEIKGIPDPAGSAGRWLAVFGMTEKGHALLSDLSFGMKKKIALSTAFLGDPPLLVLDEPFNGLDVATMERLTEVILKRYAEGATILLSSHLMPYIDRLCHRVMILKRGKVIREGTPKALKEATGDDSFHAVFLRLTQNSRDPE